jgi:hypothetical protein
MKMRKYIQLLILSLAIGFSSCENFLKPLEEGNRLTDDLLMASPEYLEGLLIKAYSALPNNYNAFNVDVAADDAVTNQQGAAITNMATGGWTSSFYPISEWENAYEQIRHINLFLDKYEDIVWAFNPVLTDEQNAERNVQILRRLKGEAHALRGYYQSLLLQYHGGKNTAGTLLGFPIITEPLGIDDNWELPRNTFAECVDQIMEDLDIAITELPPVYADIADSSMYNAAIGARYENRINGNAARAIKARVALMAASPAFSDANAVTWAEAADVAAELLDELGTLVGAGRTFYLYTVNRPKEIIWEQAVVQSRSAESNNFPPSLFGSGRTNPTQSLVDAFPMANGYPIDNALSGFDASNPYAGRDPRLTDYIIYNGASLKGTVINTYVDAPTDGLNVTETATRTGYYLKKFMSESANLNPNNPSNANHTYVLLRMTELLLNYAEAANEAWGPDGDPNGYGFTARDKIEELRARAGITQPDAYLASITTTAQMRELIKNERRVELCFEGFRFWDIRRWNDVGQMTEPATGVRITLPNTYQYVDVESRAYASYMIYGPIPFQETLKYDLEQNAGW